MNGERCCDVLGGEQLDLVDTSGHAYYTPADLRIPAILR